MKKFFISILFAMSAYVAQCQEIQCSENYKLFKLVFHSGADSTGNGSYFCTKGVAFTNETIYLNDYLDKEYFNRYVAEKGKAFSFDTLFTPGDVRRMKEVCSKYAKLVPDWDRKLLARKDIVVFDDLKKKFRPSLTALYYHAGIPLYSEDRQHAMLYVESICNGNCDHGSIFVFSKKSGSWKILTELIVWTS